MMFSIKSSKPFALANNVEQVWSRIEPSQDEATSPAQLNWPEPIIPRFT